MIITAAGDLEMAIVKNHNAVCVERFGLLIGEEAQDRFAVGIARRETRLFDHLWIDR